MGTCCSKPKTTPGRSTARGKGRSVSGGRDTIDGIPVTHPDLVEPAGLATAAKWEDEAADPAARYQPAHQDPEVANPILNISRLIPIRYAPANEWSKCAYCDNPTGDRYDYFYCASMSFDLLEDLMEHGWWRTGQVIFKPRFKEVCCPGYAMRMQAATFVPSKSHRRTIRRWTTFLTSGDPRWEQRQEYLSLAIKHTVEAEIESLMRAAVASTCGSTGIEGLVHSDTGGGAGEGSGTALNTSGEKPLARQRKTVTPGKGADPNKPPCKKAKQLRAERRRQKLALSGADAGSGQRSPTIAPPKKTLKELLSSHKPNACQKSVHTLQVELLSCNPRDPRLNQTLHKAYQIYDKFQRVVHPGKVRFSSVSEFEWGFFNSPVRTPPGQLLGTYHMHYYLDGELLMISILDILPTYVVSIYFIYDPDIRFMTPGIYTCLCELELVQDLQQQYSNLTYYALGYYNHFSPKVSYKRQFGPQELLCNETDTFVPLSTSIPKFAIKPYIRLAGEHVPEKEGRTAPMDNLVIDAYTGPTPFGALHRNEQEYYRNHLRDFISEAGSSISHKFLFDIMC